MCIGWLHAVFCMRFQLEFGLKLAGKRSKSIWVDFSLGLTVSFPFTHLLKYIFMHRTLVLSFALDRLGVIALVFKLIS